MASDGDMTTSARDLRLDDAMIESAPPRGAETIESGLLHGGATTAKDPHRDDDHPRQPDRRDHFDLFMPISG